MSVTSSPHVKYTRLDRAGFLALLNGYQSFIEGRGDGRVVTARFLIARDMHADARRLHDIDFTGSDLSGSSFKGSDLRRANFYCVNLSGCDLSKTRLERADLRGARLAGADLSFSVMDESDLRGGLLMQADSERGLNRASFDGDGGVDFSNCSLRGARMRGANLKNADFSGANLDGADLAGAKLTGCKFQGAIMTGVDVSKLGLPKSAFEGCVLEPDEAAQDKLIQIRDEIERAHAWVTTGGKAGRPAMLDGFDLRPAKELFRGRALIGLSAKGANAIGVDFSDCQLVSANFDGADLRAASFKSADLRGASFQNAKLTHAVLEGANIEPLAMRDGTVRLTRFDDAALDGARLCHLEPLTVRRAG